MRRCKEREGDKGKERVVIKYIGKESRGEREVKGGESENKGEWLTFIKLS